MNNKLIIASLHKDEAITKCILNNKTTFNNYVSIVYVPELLNDYDIHDELTDDGVSIRWYKNSKLYFSNTTHNLLNRISFIPSILFDRFISKDQSYAQREFESYLGFAFNSFNGIGNKLPNGLCQQQLSLPQQWKFAENNFGLSTPEYFGGLNTLNDLSGQLVYSDVYNYLNWKPNILSKQDEHIFCFKRPRGTPVFVTCIGNKLFIENKLELSEIVITKLKIISNCFFKELGVFISEILYFIDNESIVFGCINSDLIHSNRADGFENFVCSNLIKEVELCLN